MLWIQILKTILIYVLVYFIQLHPRKFGIPINTHFLCTYQVNVKEVQTRFYPPIASLIIEHLDLIKSFLIASDTVLNVTNILKLVVLVRTLEAVYV